MRELINQRIKYFREKIYNALDSNDTQSALLYRATIKELEFLLQNISDEPSFPCINDQYYTTLELAQLLNVHQTSITRKAEKLKGIKIPKGWLFSKRYIDSLLKEDFRI